MVYYEIKKLCSGISSKIMLGILCILLGVVLFNSVRDTGWLDEQGELESGFQAVKMQKQAKREWNGALTEERIEEVIREINRINSTPEGQSDDWKMQDIAYGWKQGFEDIRDLLNRSFGAFRVYDFYVAESLQPEDAKKFYSNRADSMRTWLDSRAEGEYSEKEKAYLISQYEKMEEPLVYEYQDGWKNLFEGFVPLLMIGAIIISLLTAPVFSSEIQLKADAIFYSSRFGRGKAIISKIKAVFVLISVLYGTMMLLFTVITLILFGAGGASCKIQTGNEWYNFFNVTNVQWYLILLAIGYIGWLFMGMLTAFVSAKTASSMFAGVTSFVLIFIPGLLGDLAGGSKILDKIMALMPDKLLRLPLGMRSFFVYDIGGKIVSSTVLMVIVYLVMILVLQPLIFITVKKRETC